MHELTISEIGQVSGAGITRREAGIILVTYGASILSGAAMGAMMGGPGGMLLGAISGAARVAVGGGATLLVVGAYKSH